MFPLLFVLVTLGFALNVVVLLRFLALFASNSEISVNEYAYLGPPKVTNFFVFGNLIVLSFNINLIY